MKSIDVVKRFDRDERWPGVLGRGEHEKLGKVAAGLAKKLLA